MATFGKDERLSSRKLIAELFASGKSFSEFPLRIVWKEIAVPSPFPAQVVISVPKRKMKKAVDRNRVKRLVRQIYRNEKQPLYDHLQSEGRQVAFMILYSSNEHPVFKELESKIIVSLSRLIKESSGPNSAATKTNNP